MSKQSQVKGAAVVGQSGGPTAVINQSLVGVIETLRGQGAIEQTLGCLHGVSGIIDDKFVDLQAIPTDVLDRIAVSPSAALGSSRDKPDRAYCERIFERFAQRNVRYFFYIGGNDSSDTCRIVNELANESGYELRCFHVPKTIDNDLVLNDHTPGYASAAKFVAQAFMGDNLDNRALPGIKIDIVMGRHAGFLTAASVLARQDDDDGPHLIYVPEAAFDADRFLADVDRVYSRVGRCLIAVSEGISDSEDTPVAERLAVEQGHHVDRDAHGNIQLSGTGALGDFLSIHIKRNLGKKLRVRADTLGYMQRSFAGCYSPVDAHEARMVGRKAAEAALADDADGSIAIQRVSDSPYGVEYPVIELATVAGKTRTMDSQHLVDGNNIADGFKDYLAPLVGELPIAQALRVECVK